MAHPCFECGEDCYCQFEHDQCESCDMCHEIESEREYENQEDYDEDDDDFDNWEEAERYSKPDDEL